MFQYKEFPGWPCYILCSISLSHAKFYWYNLLNWIWPSPGPLCINTVQWSPLVFDHILRAMGLLAGQDPGTNADPPASKGKRSISDHFCAIKLVAWKLNNLKNNKIARCAMLITHSDPGSLRLNCSLIITWSLAPCWGRWMHLAVGKSRPSCWNNKCDFLKGFNTCLSMAKDALCSSGVTHQVQH